MSIQGVIDAATQPSAFPTSPFLAQASATIAKRQLQNDTLVDEENLLDEWKRILPKNWAYDSDTANSRDPIRITQAERLHCVSDQSSAQLMTTAGTSCQDAHLSTSLLWVRRDAGVKHRGADQTFGFVQESHAMRSDHHRGSRPYRAYSRDLDLGCKADSVAESTRNDDIL
jgi:hypothetical protein